MTSSNGNIFRVTGPLCGEFTGPGEFPTQRPVTRSFDVFFDLRLNKRLSKQPWGWWFETPSQSLWCQCNVLWHYLIKHCRYLSTFASGIIVIAEPSWVFLSSPGSGRSYPRRIYTPNLLTDQALGFTTRRQQQHRAGGYHLLRGSFRIMHVW